MRTTETERKGGMRWKMEAFFRKRLQNQSPRGSASTLQKCKINLFDVDVKVP